MLCNIPSDKYTMVYYLFVIDTAFVPFLVRLFNNAARIHLCTLVVKICTASSHSRVRVEMAMVYTIYVYYLKNSLDSFFFFKEVH